MTCQTLTPRRTHPVMTDTAQGDYPCFACFSGYPDATQHLKIQRCLHPREFWSSWRIVAIAFLVPFAGIIISATIPPYSTVGVLLVMGGVAAVLCRFGIHLWEGRCRRRYQAAIERNPRTGWVDADGIHVQLPTGQTSLGWDGLSGFLDLGETIGLVRDHCVIDELASSMFASPAEWRRARQMILDGTSFVQPSPG